MYNNMRKIYLKNQPMFSMAVAYLLDIGFRTVRGLTDEEISGMEGNGLMTAEFVQSIATMARSIAEECGNNVVELIQFCQAEDVFDTEWYMEDEYDD